jgi:hypothetical protein
VSERVLRLLDQRFAAVPLALLHPPSPSFRLVGRAMPAACLASVYELAHRRPRVALQGRSVIVDTVFTVAIPVLRLVGEGDATDLMLALLPTPADHGDKLPSSTVKSTRHGRPRTTTRGWIDFRSAI